MFIIIIIINIFLQKYTCDFSFFTFIYILIYFCVRWNVFANGSTCICESNLFVHCSVCICESLRLHLWVSLTFICNCWDWSDPVVLLRTGPHLLTPPPSACSPGSGLHVCDGSAPPPLTWHQPKRAEPGVFAARAPGEGHPVQNLPPLRSPMSKHMVAEHLEHVWVGDQNYLPPLPPSLPAEEVSGLTSLKQEQGWGRGYEAADEPWMSVTSSAPIEIQRREAIRNVSAAAAASLISVDINGCNHKEKYHHRPVVQTAEPFV